MAITQTFPFHDAAPPWFLHLLALSVLLLTFKPVWRWVQPRVHHVVYAADEPTSDALGQMSDTLAQTTPGSSMLATIAETIAQIMNVPCVQVEVLDGATVAVGKPRAAAAYTRTEIRYGDVLVGWLEVGSRLPGEPLTAGEYQLLQRLARQVGITLHAAQLNEALQASREQLVTAREEERRRIRRDLHDGLGPALAGLRMQLSALRHSLRDDPAAAEALIDSLRDDVRAATADIRRLVYDLRPPLLDEHGLLGAIRHLAGTLDGATLTLDAPAALPPLPAAVEVAVYRIAAEAVQNVAKHAGASACAIQLRLGETALTLQVRDNGAGLPAEYAAGVGLVSMRERAAELGGQLTIDSAPGGTCVIATIPCKVRA
ncbi:sensor histidine kinase [Kouleothrix sp.]|uniref:sensor histidine kinase n=1 Tax=Kouleothrix sp. TaxID=2779161 RepID=UPI00391B5FB2